MYTKSILTLCATLAISATLINNADAANWKDMLNNVNGKPASQQVASVAQPVQAGSLTELLMQRTGVNGAQAQGGAGALFQVAKHKMSAESFTQLEKSVPGIQSMLAAAPALSQQSGLAGRLSSIAGASGAKAGDILAVASAFQQQGMSPAMIQQFIPVVIDYIKTHGNDALVNSLSSALPGH